MWKFRIRQAGDMIRDPVESEFFSEERDDAIARPLIREAIQNSMDARSGDEPARVRFSTGSVIMGSDERDELLSPLIPHVESQTSGFRDSSPIKSTAVTYLTVEDFNTVGLEGDENSDEPPDEGSTNHFYYFWRNIGQGKKAGDERGRWGLGKTVFPAASQLGTIFGLSIRESDSNRSLMGLSVMKNHWVDGEQYQPYHFFATHADDGFPEPIRNDSQISVVSEVFDLARTVEPGLSVVVVAPVPEITAESILTESIEQYFYPIVFGELVVEIATSATTTVVDRAYLESELGQITRRNRHIGDLISLAMWYADFVEPVPEIHPELVESEGAAGNILREQLQVVANRFEEHERIAVRIPVTIYRKNGESIGSTITVLAVRHPGTDVQNVVFIRQGLTISRMQISCPSGTRYLVVAEDGPIASFLGDAENPAHTRWLGTERLRESYVRYTPTIQTVRQAASVVHRMLIGTQPDLDVGLLSKFFPTPAQDPTRRKQPARQKQAPDGEKEDPTPPDSRPIRRFNVTQVDGGFSVTQGETGSETPDEFSIRAAYDTTGGNPFSMYETADFRLDRPPLVVENEDCSVRTRTNTIEVTDLSPEFKVTVTGFDEDRDVITDVRIVG